MTRPHDSGIGPGSDKTDHHNADAAADECEREASAPVELLRALREEKAASRDSEQGKQPEVELCGDEDPLQDPRQQSTATQLLHTYLQRLASDADEDTLLAQLSTFSKTFQAHSLHRYVIALLTPYEELFHEGDQLHRALWEARCSLVNALVSRVDGEPARANPRNLDAHIAAVVWDFCDDLAAYLPDSAATVERVLALWKAPSEGHENAALFEDDAMALLLLTALVRKSVDAWLRGTGADVTEAASSKALEAVWDKTSKTIACFSGECFAPWVPRALHDAGMSLLRHSIRHTIVASQRTGPKASRKGRSTTDPAVVSKVAALLFEKAGEPHLALECWARSINDPLNSSVRDLVRQTWFELAVPQTSLNADCDEAYAALAVVAVPKVTAARLALSRIQRRSTRTDACCQVIVARLRELLRQRGPLRRDSGHFHRHFPQMGPTAVDYWVQELVKPLPQSLVNDLDELRELEPVDGRYRYCRNSKMTAFASVAALELLCTAEGRLEPIEKALAPLLDPEQPFFSEMGIWFAGGILINWTFKILEMLSDAGLRTAKEHFRRANCALHMTPANVLTTGSMNSLEGLMDVEAGLLFAGTLIKCFTGNIVLQICQKLPDDSDPPKKGRSKSTRRDRDADSAIEALMEVKEVMARLQRTMQDQQDQDDLAAWFGKLHRVCCCVLERRSQQ